jgi:hypothetical protein
MATWQNICLVLGELGVMAFTARALVISWRKTFRGAEGNQWAGPYDGAYLFTDPVSSRKSRKDTVR